MSLKGASTLREPQGRPEQGRGATALGLNWQKSLYWRIALGLFAFVALMLAAEGALFLWASERLARTMPARSPRLLAALVAQDVGAALTRDANLNLEEYVRGQYENVAQTFFVSLRDGRIVSNHDDVPADVLAAFRADVLASRGARRRGRGPDWPGERFGDRPDRQGERPLDRPDDRFPDRSPGFGPPPFRGGGGRPDGPFGETAPIFASDAQVGRVTIWTDDRPFLRTLRQLGPTMAVIAAGIFGVGTALIALVVFGPVRRRLKDVQNATERLGGGDLSARAPEHGGDEVAALARSFNQMADELTRRARELEASDQMRRQLMADVSHELMTPLTAMRGYIETLTMPEVQLDAQTRHRYMGIVTDETHRLEQIIGDLLDLARLEGGGMTFRHDRADVELLFNRVGERHERNLSDRRITLTTHVDTAARVVIADADRLEQALQNLAANAIRHTPEGGQIQLTAARQGDEIVLTVRDNGPGIPSEHLPLIFNRFYKADASRKASGGGSGLGLSIAKAIIERHGGTISVRNENGAVFEIRLLAEGDR
jgi:signal transduction histidine kinase